MDFDRIAAYEARAIEGEEREAAVIIPVIARDDGDYVLFTKRADHLPDHPGQMSFPGGGREPEDDDLLDTALREATEEIGLDRLAAHVVGRIDDIRTVSRYSVRPFVARIPDRAYQPSDEEVAEVVVLPISGLTDLDNYESESRDHPYYGPTRLHFFYVDGYTVWGATAKMLVQFLDLATEWELPSEPDRHVGPDDDLPESVRDQVQ